MRLNGMEKAVCKYFSQRGSDGLVRCCDCPLVIDNRSLICKANISEENWEDWGKDEWDERNRNKTV